MGKESAEDTSLRRSIAGNPNKTLPESYSHCAERKKKKTVEKGKRSKRDLRCTNVIDIVIGSYVGTVTEFPSQAHSYLPLSPQTDKKNQSDVDKKRIKRKRNPMIVISRSPNHETYRTANVPTGVLPVGRTDQQKSKEQAGRTTLPTPRNDPTAYCLRSFYRLFQFAETTLFARAQFVPFQEVVVDTIWRWRTAKKNSKTRQRVFIIVMRK